MKIIFPKILKIEKEYLVAFVALLFVAVIILSILIVKTKRKILLELLYDDAKISTSLKDEDLNGHTLFVERGGIIFDNIENGEIIITESVGAGTVTFKNCRKIDVVVQSKANLLLDDKTSIQNLYIKDNARVASINSIESKYRKKSKSLSLFKKKKSETQAEILNTEIDGNLNPLLEGGAFVAVKENKNFSAKTVGGGVRYFGENPGSKLYIERNDSYTGNGFQVFIHNRPENAEVLHIQKVHDGLTEEMDWNSSTNYYSEKFFSDTYTYEFLNAGEQYEIIFEYLTEDSHEAQFVDKVVVSIVPKRGRDIVIDRNNRSLSVDEDTGDIFWIYPPKVQNLPQGAVISFYIQSRTDDEWSWIGYHDCSPYENKTINIYRNMKNLDIDKILDGQIYIEVFYKYETCRWKIMETTNFRFDKLKYIQNNR